jgi:hypothetical protein
MQQNRKRDQDVPTRASNMEKAEGSREQMTNRERSSEDLGTSTDRAMFDDEGEPRASSNRSSDRGSGMSDEKMRGSGTSGERNRGSSGGGISNRGRDREQSEQAQLPERGRSQSER